MVHRQSYLMARSYPRSVVITAIKQSDGEFEASTSFQLHIKRHRRLDRMYGNRDKRQLKSNNKLDQQHELEFSRDSECRAHAEMTPAVKG